MPALLPQEALLNNDYANQMKAQIGRFNAMGKQAWLPLHRRMDYWATMYFLEDAVQQSKPIGFRQFISNEPRTVIDAAVAIMTRNDAFWRIDLNQMESENKDERAKIGKIERSLQGIVNDLDEMFSMRGDMPLWKSAAFMALLRGQIWGKFHVTNAALDYRESPITAEVYDSRMVIPHYDQYGLAWVIIEKDETLGAIDSVYPGVFSEMTHGKQYNPNTPATKIEFWSNDRGGVKGISGTLAVVSPTGAPQAVTSYAPAYGLLPEIDTLGANARWLIPPYQHGYDPQSLPVIGVPVNGVPIQRKPAIPRRVASAFAAKSRQYEVHTRLWHGSQTAVAERGRSILASVEESVPQSNELVATVMQHLSLDTYPTWVFKTPTGELPNFEPNLNSRIPLRPEESVERIGASPISTDAFRLMEILQREKEQGTLSSILRADAPISGGDQGSGILFQQRTNAALNALEPFHDGMEIFSQRMGTSVLRQLQLAASDNTIKKFTISVPFKQHTYFDIEFDPKADLETGRKYKARAVFLPALPDDMHIRIQMARLALDPRRPVLSLVTVLERILKQEDPQGEVDRMWEDMANQDPIIVLEQIAQALDRFGEEEMAVRIRENEFRMRFLQDAQFKQLTGSMPGLGGGEEPLPTRPGPESGAPGSTTRNEGSPEQPPTAQEGANLVGAMGERRGP